MGKQYYEIGYFVNELTDTYNSESLGATHVVLCYKAAKQLGSEAAKYESSF